jgi:hypothetical protein
MIDITFDTYSDTPAGKDPDSYSPTLRRYHRLLWSKTLPNGTVFELSDTVPGAYLHHRSEVGEFFLSSDAITHSYKNTKSLAPILCQLPAEYVEGLFKTGSTVGSYIIFPSKKIDRKMTINGARGTNSKIKDRFDLTMECIRRHYANEESPLGETLQRYSAFFDLFEDFQGYVDFFLLQDLVSDDNSSIKFYLPFDNFERPALPQDVDEYLTYRQLTLNFISARNERIRNADV